MFSRIQFEFGISEKGKESIQVHSIVSKLDGSFQCKWQNGSVVVFRGNGEQENISFTIVKSDGHWEIADRP